MTVKLNHYWTINPRKFEDYSKFMINDFIPRVNHLNMHTVAGWTVLVGAYSEIIFESVANDLETLEKAMRTPEYQKVKTALLKYIKKYKTKVLVKTGQKDTYSTDIREDTIKFNQMWDIIAEKQEEYDRFSTGELFPTLEDLGIHIAGEWEVFIGDGPHIICEGRVSDVSAILTKMQSKQFRKIKLKLKKYVENYESRILSFHIQKIKGYKSASYNIVSY